MNDHCDDNIDLVQLTVAFGGKGVNNNPHIGFLVRVMTSDLRIADFPHFSEEIKELFIQCKQNISGKPASYIPELAKGPVKNWGASVCTIEGQRLNLGHSKYPFSI